MGLPPDKMVPKLTDLIKHGMADLSVRALDFDPTVGACGTQPSNERVSWSVTITPKAAARPLVRAVRPDAAEALEAASERFLAIFRDKKKLDPFEHAQPAVKPKKTVPKPEPEVEPDDFNDLI